MKSLLHPFGYPVTAGKAVFACLLAVGLAVAVS
jgi:hypothetical protein